MPKLLPTIHYQSARERRFVRALFAVLLLASTAAGIHVSAASADPRMPVQISPQTPSVAAGEYLSYNAFVGCSIPEGCTDAVFTFTEPPGASGPGVVAKPYPPGVTSVEQAPDGGVTVTFSSVAVGTTKQLTVSWPTVDYYTAPGAQPVTMTGTAGNASGPSTAETTMDLTAAPNPTVAKSGPASVALDTEFTYSISASNYSNLSRGGLALADATIVDHLPDGLEFVSASGNGVWDPAARTITWRPDTNAAMSGGQFAGSVGYSVTVIAPSTATPSLVGTTLTNTATLSGTPLGGGDPVTKTDDASTGIIGTGTPDPRFTKYAPTTVGDGQGLTYDLRVTNSGTAVGSAVVSDTMPAAVDIRSVAYASNGTDITVTYDDASTASFTYAGGILPIAKSGTRVAKVVIHTPQIGIGATNITKFWGIADRDALPDGDTSLQNCATVQMGDETVSDCADTQVTAPQVNGQISKSTSQEPVNPGGTHDWTIKVTSGAAPLYPKMIDLLPTQLDYVDGSFAFVSTAGGTCPAATDFDLSIVPDYLNGRDALQVVGKDGVALRAGDSCVYRYTTKVKPGTPAGNYTGSAAANWIYLFDGLDQPFIWGTRDAADIDKDGVTDEIMSYGGDNFAVAMASAAGITKQVRGDRDTAWLGSAEVPGQQDQVGTSEVGGTVDWQVAMGNEGNRDLTDLVAYDLLPHPASPGTTDGRYDDTKPYEWVPTLTGPIDAGDAPVAITYSTKTDPCRPEMDATHGSASFWCGGQVDASFVPAADVADWSAIRSIRFDFGDHVFPGGEFFTFDWTMDVPTVGPDGSPLHDGDETWNKVAVQAARLDGDGTALPLLPAEAPWVVDRIYIPPTPLVDIEKTDTLGHDADTADAAVTVPEGATTDLELAIANTGDDALVDVTVTDVVTDGAATVSGLSCDFSPLGGPASGTTWAGPFEPGESFTCTGTLSALDPGDAHVDSATVTGTGRATGTVVDDEDPFHAITEPDPAIDIEKADAAGNDADTLDAEVTVPNDTETDLEFAVTNDGNEPLVDVEVTDAVTAGDGTVTGLSCDFSPLGGPASGTTWAGPFEPGESFTCTGTLSALTPGSHHVDEATVTGTGRYSGTEVDDDDPYLATTPPLVSVGDRVWFDTDRDGVQDADEDPVAGVTVNLYDADGQLLATTTTDADGSYAFTDLRASTEHQIGFVAPDGATFTGQDLGGDDATDSDADTTTGMTRVFTTPATGENSPTEPDDPTWDAGIVQLDLSITKELASEGPFTAGDEVRFTLIPHNEGPVSALAGWSVTDLLPEGLTLVSITGEGYRCDAATATCVDTTGALLAPGADGAPITVRATIDAGVDGPLRNVTWVTPDDGDIDETNPLEIPGPDTDTDETPTNNDDQADLVVDEEPPPATSTTTTTTSAPTRVIDEGVGRDGSGPAPRVHQGSLPRTGGDVAGPVVLGVVLTLLGLGFVAASRRRHAR